MQYNDRVKFGNEFIFIFAHASGDLDGPALALSEVHGLDANNAFQADAAFDDD